MENLFQMEKQSRPEITMHTEIQHGFNANNDAIEDERQSGAIGYAVGAL